MINETEREHDLELQVEQLEEEVMRLVREVVKLTEKLTEIQKIKEVDE